MNNPPKKSSKYKQGIFISQNPDKYVGDATNIIYRSSWELRAFKWLDEHPDVLFWNSESLMIPYFYEVDQKMHRYYVDLVAQMKTKTGIKVFAIEIKPAAETLPPNAKTKNKARLLVQTQTYLKNQAKWKAATAFCASKGIQFIVIDEYDLSIKKRPA